MESYQIDRLIVKRELLAEEIEKKENEKSKLDNFLKTITDSLLFLKSCAVDIQNQIKVRVDRVVNETLKLFWEDYNFSLVFDSITRLEFKKKGKVYNIFEQNGGGLLDIVAFSLRIALFSLTDRNKIIFLDEPFKFLDNSKVKQIEELLNFICDEYGVQIIMATHNDFESNKKVYMENERSVVI